MAPVDTKRDPCFATTHWSVVLAAQQNNSPDASEALAKLCKTYWYPLYAFVRRTGHNPEDAQDLVQEYFSRLLEKNWLDAADRERGRFRSFLLATLKHFLSHESRKTRAEKRGSNYQVVPLDQPSGETRYLAEPVDQLTPEMIFERRWAITLLEGVMHQVQKEYSHGGRTRLFDVLQTYLSGERNPGSYVDTAALLQMSEGAVRVAVHRLRKRYGELLRSEIAQTVLAPQEIDGELQHLFQVLSR